MSEPKCSSSKLKNNGQKIKGPKCPSPNEIKDGTNLARKTQWDGKKNSPRASGTKSERMTHPLTTIYLGCDEDSKRNIDPGTNMDRMTHPLTTHGDNETKFPLEPNSRPPKRPPTNITGAAVMCSERKSDIGIGKKEKIRRELIKNGEGELKMILVVDKGLKMTMRKEEEKTEKIVPKGGKCEKV